MGFDFQIWMETSKKEIELILNQYLPAPNPNNPLPQSMRYAVLGHGKRIRPLLAMAAAQLGQADPIILKQNIAALEFMHSYSLIHDDLPSMDNDDLRHGKPSCHKVFGEAMALLAGDALQTLAFETVSQPQKLNTTQVLKAVEILAKTSGINGMAGGQALDLNNTGKKINLAALENMHTLKTGALITAAVQLGYLACENFQADIFEQLHKFALNIGLAFQIIDDILDDQTDTAVLGKTAGKDLANDKATFVSLMGINAAKEYASKLKLEALQHVAILSPHNQALVALAEFMLERKF